jgi:hypothetical protein
LLLRLIVSIETEEKGGGHLRASDGVRSTMATKIGGATMEEKQGIRAVRLTEVTDVLKENGGRRKDDGRGDAMSCARPTVAVDHEPDGAWRSRTWKWAQEVRVGARNQGAAAVGRGTTRPMPTSSICEERQQSPMGEGKQRGGRGARWSWRCAFSPGSSWRRRVGRRCNTAAGIGGFLPVVGGEEDDLGVDWERPRLISLQEENKEREAELVVFSVHRGVVGDGGSTAN